MFAFKVAYLDQCNIIFYRPNCDSAAETIYAYPQKFVVRVLGSFVEPVDKLDSPRDQSLDS